MLLNIRIKQANIDQNGKDKSKLIRIEKPKNEERISLSKEVYFTR